MNFIQTELRESRLFRSTSALSNKTAEDIKNIMFLYFIGLVIMSDEFETAVWSQEYLTKTFRYGSNFKKSRMSDTDLYWCIHLISEKKTDLLNKKFKEENELAFDRTKLDIRQILIWVKKTIRGMSTQNDHRRFLLSLENSLKIKTSDYKDMRRLASSWEDLSNQQRSVLCTRLKFALNKYARISEIYPEFEQFIKNKNYLIKDAVDPELPQANKSDTLKGIGLGIAAGLMGSIGMAIANKEDLRSKFRSHYKGLSETTSAGNIAGTASVMNIGTIERPKIIATRFDRKKKS